MRREKTDRFAVFLFIAYKASEGAAPTNREICNDFGWTSTVSARHHVSALIDLGLLVRVPRVSRGLRVTDAGLAELARHGGAHVGTDSGR